MFLIPCFYIVFLLCCTVREYCRGVIQADFESPNTNPLGGERSVSDISQESQN